MDRRRFIEAARGDRPADLLLSNGRLINVFSGEIHQGNIGISQGYICGFHTRSAHQTIELDGRYVAPGFIDAHVHIESAMTAPGAFCRAVVRCGTTTVIADPHEIANVMGLEGIKFMLRASADQPVNVYFGLPSCVPASSLETAGAHLTADDLSPLMTHPRVVALGEVMNFPGVINGDAAVLHKLHLARQRGLVLDGHAPGLSGAALDAYLAAGIASDHECTRLEEAQEKLRAGMHIMIRQGTGAKNLAALLPLVAPDSAQRLMWCTDDRHPHDLLHRGHIDDMVRQAIAAGMDPVTAIRMATLAPATYFGLDHLGAIAPGRQADLVVFADIGRPTAETVYQKGKAVVRDGVIDTEIVPPVVVDEVPTVMNIPLQKIDFTIAAAGGTMRIIELVPGQIITRATLGKAVISDGKAVSCPEKDVLKIAVVERYSGKGGTGLAFVKGFGLKQGALAATVAHDSHNVIVVGADDESMHGAVAEIMRLGGGLAAFAQGRPQAALPLPIAGLMSVASMERVARDLDRLTHAARGMGATIEDPFMALGFLALPVIPSLKITDKGLVDVERFQIVELFSS